MHPSWGLRGMFATCMNHSWLYGSVPLLTSMAMNLQ